MRHPGPALEAQACSQPWALQQQQGGGSSSSSSKTAHSQLRLWGHSSNQLWVLLINIAQPQACSIERRDLLRNIEHSRYPSSLNLCEFVVCASRAVGSSRPMICGVCTANFSFCMLNYFLYVSLLFPFFFRLSFQIVLLETFAAHLQS
jgi:hypothetical protein